MGESPAVKERAMKAASERAKAQAEAIKSEKNGLKLLVVTKQELVAVLVVL